MLRLTQGTRPQTHTQTDKHTQATPAGGSIFNADNLVMQIGLGLLLQLQNIQPAALSHGHNTLTAIKFNKTNFLMLHTHKINQATHLRGTFIKVWFQSSQLSNTLKDYAGAARCGYKLEFLND